MHQGAARNIESQGKLGEASSVINGIPSSYDLKSREEVLAIRQANQEKRREPLHFRDRLSFTDVHGEAHSRDHGLSFLDPLLMFDPEKYGIGDCFKDRAVIDLGAGTWGGGYELCKDLGARSYVGVEYCFGLELYDELFARKPEIPSAVVFADMLGFLKDCQNLDASFLICAVDRSIVNQLYQARVVHELVRLLQGDNVFLTLYSDFRLQDQAPVIDTKIAASRLRLYSAPKSE